jgi:hypothetical protein
MPHAEFLLSEIYKVVQIPRSKLNKALNDLFTENNKHLKKQIEEDNKRWRDLP